MFQVSQVGEVLRALGTNPTEGEVKKLIQSTVTVSWIHERLDKLIIAVFVHLFSRLTLPAVLSLQTSPSLPFSSVPWHWSVWPRLDTSLSPVIAAEDVH